MKKSRAVKIAGTFAVCLALARPGRAEFAYVANGSSNNVLGYTVNGATGALTPVAGSPFAAGTFPISVTVDPAGKFAYVTNELDNTISGYSINAATGALTPIAGSPFATGARPFSVVIDPTGKFAFVANANDNNLSGYAINAVTGALTPVPGSPFAAGFLPTTLAVDPTGKFVYVVNYAFASDSVSGYAINPATGTLTPVPGSPFPTAGQNPRSIAVDPTGKFVYVANQQSDSVSGYAINAATGTLTPIAGSPFAGGSNPSGVAVDPTGKLVYVANFSNNGVGSVSAFTVNGATGALTPVAGSPFAAGSGPVYVAVDPTGKFVYVTNSSSSNVSGFSLNAATGALAPLAGSPFPAAGEPLGIFITAGPMAPLAPPVISKTFGGATVPLNGMTSLSFTVMNPNAALALTGVGFTDMLPSGLVVSTPNGLTGSCGGGTISTTLATVTLNGAMLAQGASCTFSVNVTGTTAGIQNNSVTVSDANAGTGNTANASVTVLAGVAPPTISKTFGAPIVSLGGSTTLTFAVANPNGIALTGVAFTDTLPTGLAISMPNGLSGSCGGGTIRATTGSNTVSLTGATLAANASCNFSVNVTGTAIGTQINTTSAVASTNGGTGLTATATILVQVAGQTSDVFQVRYAANLNVGDSFIDITNTGASSTTAFPTQDGTICVNVYAFSPDEQLISCCTCPVTPSGLASLSARNDLVSNTLTPGVPTGIVVKLLATAGTAPGSCNAATAGTGTNILVPGLGAWGT
ncbi:MAG: beta-propeller fold lactonase family protein, partial [Acidobacteriota bacterium]|nr:beta-propeller fold lactonase family protein [Acidobacteriota bacterium]